MLQLYKHFYEEHSFEELKKWGINKALLSDAAHLSRIKYEAPQASIGCRMAKKGKKKGSIRRKKKEVVEENNGEANDDDIMYSSDDGQKPDEKPTIAKKKKSKKLASKSEHRVRQLTLSVNSEVEEP